MEIYGSSVYIKTVNEYDLPFRNKGMRDEKKQTVTTDDIAVYTDPFSYFNEVLTNKIAIEPYSLYSLENNVRVVEILDAARKSANEGKTIY